ncbi:cilia- and flagella-associated protein 157-like [Tubulanus polymorphus]|uniref:cilia- and flagella-associated protein 157-like n=1 Tax=Tubulanus polymorphus TaxID=672921 RepID=UPI003DA24407
MPPKKKSGKKKKKSGKKSAKSTTSAPPAETLSELGKEFYLIQIRDLENRLARYQRKCDELEIGNSKFKEQYDQMGQDKKEIVSFLKKSLEQRGDEIADLNDRLIGLQQAKDAEKEMYEQQLQQLRTEFQETKDQLTSENMILGGKLASLEEFKVQKEDLMAKFAQMEEQLKRQEEEHKEVIYNLERKQVVDKDRLKKEMVMRVNQVAAEFRKVSNKQMAETTKRTIRENVSINAQLTKMSDKTMELIQENDEIREKDKKERQQIEMLEANEKELAKKNHSNQKIIRMLTEKCKNQEAMLAEYELREQEYQELDTEAELLRQQVDSTRDEIQLLAKENEQLEGDYKSTRSKLHGEQKSKRKVEKILSDLSAALKNSLQTTPVEDQIEHEEAEKRDNLLENMLIILNSAAALGIGPTPGEFHEIRQRRSASSVPGSGKGLRKGEQPLSPICRTPRGTEPHYQLGDLGLIPRPNDRIPTSIDKVQKSVAGQHLGSLKRVLTKSVAIQTVSSPKALFYADMLLSKAPLKTQTAIIHELHQTQPRSSKMAGKKHLYGKLLT